MENQFLYYTTIILQSRTGQKVFPKTDHKGSMYKDNIKGPKWTLEGTSQNSRAMED